jgi:outer membrane protein insertion porin family
MIRTTLTALLVLLASLAWAEPVRDLDVRGNLRVERDLILQQVSTRAGDEYDVARVRADIAAIYALGYFEDIAVEFSEKGRLTFVVLERPALREWRTEGADEVDAEDVRKAVPLARREIVDQARVEEGARGIRELYREKGYYLATVVPEAVPVDDGKNQVDVVYRVDEGEKVKVRDIHLGGVETGDPAEIRKFMATREADFLSWITGAGTFKEAELARDREVIRSYYLNRGHVDVEVSEPLVSLLSDRKGIRVDIPISEGEEYSVASVSFSGDLEFTEEELRAAVPLRAGETFRSEDFRKANQKLVDLYGGKGYAFVEVDPKTRLDADARTVALEFDIHKGPLVNIGRIEIRGNTKTRDRVLRREMDLAEGDLYNGPSIDRSRRRLERLGFFETINLSTHRRPGTDLLDVDIEVVEKATGSFSVGAGYSSVDKIVGMASVSQRNFLGYGYQLSLQLNAGTERQTYSFTFNNPRVFDTRVYAGFDAWKSRVDYTEYDKKAIGGAVKLGTAFNDEWSTRWTYRLEDADVTNVDPSASIFIKDQEGKILTSALLATLSYDSRDNRWEPHHGSDLEWSVELAGGPLGGDADFVKYGVEAAHFVPLWFRHVFGAHGRIGYIQELSGEIPIYELYTLGGINTLRGFDSRSIGPKDPDTGDVIGGNKEILINLEYLFPLIEEAKVRGLFFFDAGNAWDKDDDYFETSLRKSVGAGIRWFSPMGPLRLEWGYVLGPKSDEDQSQWEFSIGGFF